MRIRGKDDLGENASNVSPVPQLWLMDEIEGRTNVTRVGPAWRHAISEPDTMESERPPNFEDDVSRALNEFRAEQEKRNRNLVPVMFVMGCAVGILVAIVPHSRLFRSHFARTVAAAPFVAPAPASPEPQSRVATSAIEASATPPAPMPATVASPPAPVAATKHARARAASSRASAPMPDARSSSHRAKSSAATEDDDVVKNAHAADDLAAAQLTDAL